MKIYLRGRHGGRKKVSNARIKKLKDFMEFSMAKFVPESISNKLEIYFILDGTYLQRNQSYGGAVWLDRPKAPRRIAMEVYASPNFNILLSTIAHEIVHVKQWALGEYYFDDNKHAHHFKGRFYKESDNENAYWDYPWEVEAYGCMIGLIMQWASTREYEEESWYVNGWYGYHP